METKIIKSMIKMLEEEEVDLERHKDNKEHHRYWEGFNYGLSDSIEKIRSKFRFFLETEEG